jgi:pyridoxal phosphate enzyme (YggS family)
MSALAERIAANLGSIHERITAACRRVGRDPAGVRLVAVTKSAELPWIETLVAQGARDLGESRPQQLLERSALVAGPVTWHLVGHLQRNKIRKVLPVAAVIHAVDSRALWQRLAEVAAELGLRPRVLIEVNVSGEATKFGFSPVELRAVWRELSADRRLDLAGLMTMAPLSDDPETARPVFAGLRRLRDELRAADPGGPELAELSMGMSGDFEIAVEEGATLVRVGTALFEGLA